jgi:hypothetical protein
LALMETVLEATDRLRRVGYTVDFTATADGSLQCGACGTAHDPALMAIDEVVRFEGASDPDDELLMLALRCECACPGLYVTGFGSSASPADVAVLHRLR